jgi:hypothetical protein
MAAEIKSSEIMYDEKICLYEVYHGHVDIGAGFFSGRNAAL